MILTSEPDGGNVRHWCNMLPGWRSAGARESSPQLTLCSCHRHSLQATCSGIMSCQWNLKNRQYSDAARGTCCAAYCVTEHLTPPPPKWLLRHKDYISHISGGNISKHHSHLQRLKLSVVHLECLHSFAFQLDLLGSSAMVMSRCSQTA